MIKGTRIILPKWSSKVRCCKRFCSTSDKTKIVGDGKKDYIGIAFFSGICIAAAGLGTWQVQRFFWKQNLVSTIKDSAAAPPQTVTKCSDQNQLCQQLFSLKGQRVLLTGRFEHDKEVYLGLRSAPPSFGIGPAQGMATNPQGYYVITPLLRDDGTVVHVNRGWVPRAMVMQKQPGQTVGAGEVAPLASKLTTQQQPALWSRPEGLVSLEVVIGEGEKAGRFSPVNQPGTTAMLWLDPTALLARTGCVGQGGTSSADCVIIAEAIDNDTTSGNTNRFPYAKSAEQLQEQSVPPATHFVYALTWFSLATAGFYMTYTRFRRGNTGSKGKFRR